MTKRKPKRKPIPNAEEVARSLKDAVKPWYDMAKGFGVPERDAEIMERGRTIGHIEAIENKLCYGESDKPSVLEPHEVARVLPILRSELARLRSAKP